MKRIWIFGDSLSLPFNLRPEESGWDQLLASQLGRTFENLAAPAVDNFYIYYRFLQVRNQINSNDIVIVGWSHYSRKVFVVNRENEVHNKILDCSMVYDVGKVVFMRNNNHPLQDNPTKWLTLQPVNSNVEFYDRWYNDYYSELEQKTYFQSHLESVKHTCPGIYVPFYFSQESIKGIDLPEFHAGFITEFIIHNNVCISDLDAHPNQTGHNLWASHLYNIIHNHISQD